jgi:Amt family ammonium transporter
MMTKSVTNLLDHTTDPQQNDLAFDVVTAVLHTCEIGFFVVDEGGFIRIWNNWLERTSGLTSEYAVGQSLASLFPELELSSLSKKISQVIETGLPRILSPNLHQTSLPLYKNRSDRQRGLALRQMVILKRISKDQQYCVVQIVDMSASAAREQQLREQTRIHRNSELHNRAILSSIADAVITTDPRGHIDYLNKAAEHLTGWMLEDAHGKPVDWVFKVIDEPSQRPITDLVHYCLKDGQMHWQRQHELVLIRRDGEQCAIEESLAPIRDNNGQVLGAVVVFRDVTHSRKMAAQISWQATHDSLTELDNRLAFEQQLEALLQACRKDGGVHSLLYLDLDQFKIVNDTCGHVAGDELLRQVSTLLRKHMRDQDLLARLGGDEFGVVLRNCPEQPALRIANQIRQSLQEFRFGWDGKSFTIGVSIGVVGVNRNSTDLGNLLSSADTACYSAKEAGRNQVHLFEPDESEAADRQGEMQWVTRIQKALDEQRFVLYTQLIRSIGSNEEPDHEEILIRMIDEDGRLIPPGAFIPAAERYNLMPAIDRWVIRQVFEFIAEHNSESDQLPVYSVNLSGASINDRDALLFICDEMARCNIPANSVCFEITETAAISNLASANHLINELKKRGFAFSLDDFGSGLSSFAYLKNLPVDYLKIDGAFVKDMVEDPIDRAMVEAINQIGQVMGLQTIAEFVENDQILQQLKEIGVNYAQGYGISVPKPLRED